MGSDPSNREPRFQLVGVRVNGERVVISRHTTREIAERVISLLGHDSDFEEFVVERDGESKTGQ